MPRSSKKLMCCDSKRQIEHTKNSIRMFSWVSFREMCGDVNGTPHSTLAIWALPSLCSGLNDSLCLALMFPNVSGPDHKPEVSRAELHLWLLGDRKEILLLVIYWWSKSTHRCPFPSSAIFTSLFGSWMTVNEFLPGMVKRNNAFLLRDEAFINLWN